MYVGCFFVMSLTEPEKQQELIITINTRLTSSQTRNTGVVAVFGQTLKNCYARANTAEQDATL